MGYQLKFHRAWREAGLDALVAPVHVFPATAHDSFKDISFAGSYTFLFNLLNWPAVVVPATHVLPTDVLPEVARPTLFDKLMRKHYDAEKAAALPAGVQIAGQPFQEELLLGISRQLEAVEE
jgi:fatty acid amide hydrolase